MSKAIISVENISKNYFISKNLYGSGMPTLQDVISHKIKHLFSKNGNGNGVSKFWALQDVSFEVNKGDIVGIIGKNGAGKSTLLKILSRITYPTSGRIVMRGSVASLLEVGTGFNQDLTGRENIYLNGAIMGMKKSEIDKKFDSIIDFSGVEEFIDTPVKRYSSGMYTRLSFSIAAHLEPDILIIDEVLAVGDNEFQKKCIQKMSKIAQQGMTVLFVSHDLKSISDFCSKGVLLNKGSVAFNGNITEAISHYHSLTRVHPCEWEVAD
jgi:lipopolysaccharide transport system ATP-binding protein